MIIKEINKDLLEVPQGYYLLHCIDADYSLENEISQRIDEAYNMKEKLNYLFDRDTCNWDNLNSYIGHSLKVDNVFNLVVKKHNHKKAKYKRFHSALEETKQIMEEYMISKIAISVLDCESNELEWRYIKRIMKKVFINTNVEILICNDDNVYMF